MTALRRARRARVRPTPALSVIAAVLTVLAAVAASSAVNATPGTAASSERSAPPPLPDAGMPAADAGATLDPEATRLFRAARRVRELILERLDVAVDPGSLFDVALDDVAAIRVEALRLRAVVRALDESVRRDAVVKTGRRSGASPSPTADGGDMSVSGPLLGARIELDRARLAFYDLPRARRDEILAAHAEQQRVAEAAKGTELTAAERRAKEAEAERRGALEAAANARTEAERLVAEEYAKVLEIAQKQAEFDAALQRERVSLKARSEKTLAFERRVREVVDGAASGTTPADDFYDDLRKWLRRSRDELDQALSESRSDGHEVPTPGADALGGLPTEVDHAGVDRARREALETAVRLSVNAAALHEQRLKQLGEDVRVLNEGRLDLLPHLSPAKDERITGTGREGIDQAAAELRQVALIIRYHLHAARRWATLIGRGDAGRAATATGSLVAVEWLAASVVFVWWRRRATSVALAWRERIRQRDRRERAVEPSPLISVLGFLLRVRGPLEWMAFSWVVLALLPASAAGLVEIHLARTAFVWTLGGSLAVSAIDALAGGAAEVSQNEERPVVAALRLRSLRLVGRTVVVFGLILSLSAQLVGRGTIHSWVSSMCWFAALPAGLVMVRWWREEIFQRIQRTRRKSAFDLWIDRNRQGWSSFFAASAAGIYLFVSGTIRALRSWVGRFDLTRRALAYLFRRGLDRLAEENEPIELGPLPEPLFAALGPDVSSVDALTTSASEEASAVILSLAHPRGGVFALVGERGSGKTFTLRQWRESRADVVPLDCPFGGLPALEAALAASVGLPAGAGLDEAAAILDAAGRETALFVDNAHRLIRPVMGGLAAFDRLISAARKRSTTCTWVFAMDEVVWRFFERARGARPLFDEVVVLGQWREEEIGKFVEQRSREAGVSPSYRHVVQRLPVDADEQDLAEAMQRTAGGYHRLLWDYSAGNPGVALHLFRKSLGMNPNGDVCVKPFQAPDTTDLEALPDPAVFVLRAVIQFEEATAEEIAEATMVLAGPVADTLRYGLSRGYLEKIGGRYRVTWAWFRALTRFLHRRHLLASRAD